jgi:hypothetical protein
MNKLQFTRRFADPGRAEEGRAVDACACVPCADLSLVGGGCDVSDDCQFARGEPVAIILRETIARAAIEEARLAGAARWPAVKLSDRMLREPRALSDCSREVCVFASKRIAVAIENACDGLPCAPCGTIESA